jgi:DNA-binding transcriptional ArsR family regulator
MALGLPQSAVAKHLGALREVGAVTVAQSGQQRLYQLYPATLKPMYDRLKNYERFWTHQSPRRAQGTRTEPRSLAAVTVPRTFSHAFITERNDK